MFIELAHKYIKLSYLLSKSKQIWFDKQVLSIESGASTPFNAGSGKLRPWYESTTKQNIYRNKKKSTAKQQNRRIYHIYSLSSSQKLKQCIPTTLHYFFREKQCNNATPTNILIIEKQTQNITTFPVKHNSSKNTTGSPSTSLDPPSINSDKLNPDFLNSKRRTRLNVIPISSQP